MIERFKAASEQQMSEIDNLGKGNSLIEHYQPELIGYGNDHFVYSVDGHPDVVIKVNRESIRFALQYCIKNRLTIDDYAQDEAAQTAMRERVNEFEIRQQQLVAHFGKEHCLSNRYVQLRIPTIPSFYNNMSLADTANIPDELLVVATVQKKSTANFSGQDSIHARHTHDDPDVHAYTSYTTAALTEPTAPLARPMQPDLNRAGVKEAIKDFVQKAIAYTNETGYILDLNGVNNVVLTDKNDKLTYILIDAMFPAHNWQNVISDVSQIIKEKAQNIDKEIPPDNKHKVRMAANYIRFINELANASGATERLNHLATDDVDVKRALENILSDIFFELKAQST